MEPIKTSVDHAITKVDDQFAVWGAKLKAFAAKLDVASKEAKADSHARIDDMKSKLATTQTKFDEAKAAGGAKWHAFTKDVEIAWRDLEASFHRMTH